MVDKLLAKQLSRSPESEPYWTFIDGKWSPTFDKCEPSTAETISNIHLITWNIDMSAPMAEARMSSALDYLSELVAAIPASSATIIHLQEMVDDDLDIISNSPWIQSNFHVTDLPQYMRTQWASQNNTDYMPQRRPRYDILTLIDRRLAINSVSRLRFVSEYQRDALFVDLPLASSGTHKILRICNVHLDSMTGNPPLRPIQWKAAAHWLQRDDIPSSILAGDCNAHQNYDRTAPQDLGFKDAYLELGGEGGAEDGFTWGYQCQYRLRFGPSRMDKVVFAGEIEAKSLKRIGVGVTVKGDERAGMHETEDLPFVTDHYGLMAEFDILGDGVQVRK